MIVVNVVVVFVVVVVTAAPAVVVVVIVAAAGAAGAGAGAGAAVVVVVVVAVVTYLLTYPQCVCVSQGPICSGNCTCCHTEIEDDDLTCSLTQSQYVTGTTSPSTDTVTPGAWQDSH